MFTLLTRYSIVFVHGLRGHPKHTWEHSSGQLHAAAPSKRTLKSIFRKPVPTNNEIEGSSTSHTLFWPYHYLSQDVPNATVWTYGYNADIIGGLFQANNGNSVSQHGRDLAVKVEREIDNEVRLELRKSKAEWPANNVVGPHFVCCAQSRRHHPQRCTKPTLCVC